MSRHYYTIELSSGRRFTARRLTVGDWLDLYHRLPPALFGGESRGLSRGELGGALQGLLDLAARAVEREPGELSQELTPDELAELVAQVIGRELELEGGEDG